MQSGCGSQNVAHNGHLIKVNCPLLSLFPPLPSVSLWKGTGQGAGSLWPHRLRVWREHLGCGLERLVAVSEAGSFSLAVLAET